MAVSPSGLAFDLRELAALMRDYENGRFTLREIVSFDIGGRLAEIAEECERTQKALAVARRWAGEANFNEVFSRDEAIRAGVRDGSVIDLVSVLEREMARNAALRGGAAS